MLLFCNQFKTMDCMDFIIKDKHIKSMPAYYRQPNLLYSIHNVKKLMFRSFCETNYIRIYNSTKKKNDLFSVQLATGIVKNICKHVSTLKKPCAICIFLW